MFKSQYLSACWAVCLEVFAHAPGDASAGMVSQRRGEEMCEGHWFEVSFSTLESRSGPQREDASHDTKRGHKEDMKHV